MKSFLSKVVFSVFLAISWAASSVAQESVSFNRDVRPILAANCYACHGPDEEHRESGLRLDERSSAVDLGAIVEGLPEDSTLIQRVLSSDEDEVMPPPHADRPLTPDQKKILRTWIAEGAKYENHWAFEPPKAPRIPQPGSGAWSRNPIDAFVLANLEESGLKPNREADRYTLVRRIYLDLIGLPPTVEQADQFVQSNDPKVYEKLVERLLASQQYGERWAQPWLDLARYADTNGYEKDRERSIWPYRDWVIRAINDDLPYDQFSIQQLAGDMLPNPTSDALIATGFHRNTMLNEEGGIDPLEYRFLSMVDRVATTGTVWLGLTTGCAQCHTHKYDPISHTDYYRMMGLMNNADEPDFRIPDSAKQAELVKLKNEIRQLESGLKNRFPPLEGEGALEERRRSNFGQEFSRWIDQTKPRCSKWNIIRPSQMQTNLPKLEVLEDGSIFSTGDTTKRDVYELTFDLPELDEPIEAIRLEAIPDERLPGQGPGRTYYEGRKGDFFVSEVSATLDGEKVEFNNASYDQSNPDDKAPKTMATNVFDGDGSTGWLPGKNKGVRLQLVMNLKKPIQSGGRLKIELLFERHYTVSLGRFRFATTSNPAAVSNSIDETVEGILATVPRDDWTPAEAGAVEMAFLLNTPLMVEQRKSIDATRAKLPRLNETMVMLERPDDNLRPTFRHHRGEYLNPRETVSAGLPELFTRGLDDDQLPTNRLEFANWMVSDGNPLVARVAVNREWREFFGAGLMRTNGDFGIQSKPPTHPMLLDWLAVQFKNELQWSRKKLHRLIVTSATYRQASVVSPELLKRDPENRLLARGPAFRVSGEMVRDIALQASGALSTKMFGPGVRPPQPASVTALAFGSTKWNPSVGSDRYRRSIYTFKKRTAAFAAYTVFDGPTGETCTARRNRSNTPLQALTVLNDPMYLALARELAKTMSGQNLDSMEKPVTEIFRRFLTRPPSSFELQSLMEYFQSQVERLESGELDPVEIGGDLATPQQAALVMVARVVMNLDETVTKR